MNKSSSTKNIFSKKQIITNSIVFLGLILLTFSILFRGNNVSNIINIIYKVDKKYTIIGILCMCTFITCEAINIRRSLKLFGYETRIFSCIKYALVGFFFSSITPSASGGQPMQVYYMYKDKINISHSTLALLIDLASYQFITVLLAIIGMISQYSVLSENLGQVKYLLILGVILNTSALIFILIAIFSKKLMSKIIDFLAFILKIFTYKKVDELKVKLLNYVKEYESGAIYFKENKLTVIKIIMTTLIQIVALHSITFWTYKSFGLDEYSIITVTALQAVLFISVSALPLPGAVGVSESGFMVMYKTLFPTHFLSSAMILSRGVSFYLFILVSGIIISTTYLFSIRKIKNKNSYRVLERNMEVKNFEL